MMYKRAGVLLILMLFCLCGMTALADDSDTAPLPGTADILLLHNEQVSDEELDNLRLLADTATALGKSMEISTPAQAVNRYSHYSLILGYALDSDSRLARTLVRSGTRLMLLGGQLLPDCLAAAAPELTVQGVTRSGENGVLRFAFSDAQSYDAIVTLPEHFYTADTEYTSGTLEINGRTFPFCMQSGGIRYIPLTDFTSDLSRAALMQELAAWMWDYSGPLPQKGQYLVLDQVYAYMPAQELLDRVEVLVRAKLPFVISVMPVYQNTDYPAMQQFCEVLRYAQANGGAVILHTPIVRSSVSDWTDFNAVLTDALESFTNQGVYPLGFDVPYSWTWDTDALEWMKRSRTIFVYQDTAAADFTRDTRQNLLYYNYNALVLPALALDDGGENSVRRFSAAQRISPSIPLTRLQELADTLQDNRTPYYSLWDSLQSVWADNFHLSWENGALTVNDVLCSTAYTPQPYPDHYDYKRNTLQRFTVNIQNESHTLIVLVAVVTILFLLMILYARRRQRRHFLYRTDGAAPAAPPPAGHRNRKGGNDSCP